MLVKEVGEFFHSIKSVSEHHDVYFKCLRILFVGYTSIELNLKKKKTFLKYRNHTISFFVS